MSAFDPKRTWGRRGVRLHASPCPNFAGISRATQADGSAVQNCLVLAEFVAEPHLVH
jgi:hypothetical protein